MDEPTARRRRHAGSANSVTVAQLQANCLPAEQLDAAAIQASAAAAPARTPPDGRPAANGVAWPPAQQQRPAQRQRPAQQQRPAQPQRPAQGPLDPDTEPVRHEHDDGTDAYRTSNRLAKTIAVTMVLMAGLGAVTAVAALTGGRPHRASPSAPVVQPAVIGGPAVVRPDAIIDQLDTGALRALPPSPPAGVQPESRSGLLASRDSAAELVTAFYEALPVRTSEAFELLAPGMQVDGRVRFDRGWLGTRSVESRVLPSPPGEDGLRVLVSIERLDGTLLRLLQRVEVRAVRIDGQPQLRIAGVQLLSAHRM